MFSGRNIIHHCLAFPIPTALDIEAVDIVTPSHTGTRSFAMAIMAMIMAYGVGASRGRN